MSSTENYIKYVAGVLFGPQMENLSTFKRSASMLAYFFSLLSYLLRKLNGAHSEDTSGWGFNTSESLVTATQYFH